MADYYTSFSFMLSCPDEQTVTKLQGFYTLFKEAQEYVGFVVDSGSVFKPGPTPGDCAYLLQVYCDDDNADIDQTVKFLSEYAPKAGLSGLIGFTWASWCSKPRTDSFGGGAVTINLGTGQTNWMSADQWLSEELSKAEAKPFGDYGYFPTKED